MAAVERAKSSQDVTRSRRAPESSTNGASQPAGQREDVIVQMTLSSKGQDATQALIDQTQRTHEATVSLAKRLAFLRARLASLTE